MTDGLTRFPAALFSSIILLAPFGLFCRFAGYFCTGGGASGFGSTVLLFVALFDQMLEIGWNFYPLAHRLSPGVGFSAIG
jgi:hypothetical protein